MSRIENDHYPTPAWMVDCLKKHAGLTGSIFEPCAGEDKAIVKQFSHTHNVHTNDLFYSNADMQLDMTRDLSWRDVYRELGKVDWVITNPPYNCQQPIIRNAVEFAEVGVAMLLRVTADEMVMGDHERSQWWAENPEALQIKLPRFSFAKSSKTGKWTTDSAYCQWVVWRNDGFKYPEPIVRIPHWEIDGFCRKPLVA